MKNSSAAFILSLALELYKISFVKVILKSEGNSPVLWIQFLAGSIISGWGFSLVVEHLPTKFKGIGLIPSSPNNNNKPQGTEK